MSDAEERSIEVNVITYNAAISACHWDFQVCEDGGKNILITESKPLEGSVTKVTARDCLSCSTGLLTPQLLLKSTRSDIVPLSFLPALQRAWSLLASIGCPLCGG